MRNRHILYILKNHKFFCGLIILILLLNLILYLSFIRNRKIQIADLQKIYTQTRKSGEVNTNDKIEQYFKAKKSVLAFKKALPETSEFAEKIKELNTALRKHGLSISKMMFKPVKIDNLSLWKYSTSFSVSGKYSQLKDFLANLQNLPVLFCIESISFKNRSEKSEKVDMAITISTYFK